MMMKPSVTTSRVPSPQSVWANTDRLDSWKEIAAYLRREVRTVQLWEKKEGLPVHRHFHKRLGSVFAYRSEIDVWRRRVSGIETNQETPANWPDVLPPRNNPAVRHRASVAREAYLKGRYFWNQRNEKGLRKAIVCFESAMREEPGFALPYSGLADSLTLLSFYEIASATEVMPAARRAAQKAIELDPHAAEAHASLADVFLHFDRDWQAADREYRRAIECNPDYALGYHWYANLLAARGQHEAAHLAIMHALDINPVSIITLVWAGVTSHLAHRFDQAIRHYQSALELDPQFVWAHMYMAQALEQTGDFKLALQEFDTAERLAEGNKSVKAMMAHAHAISGDRDSARGILQELGNTSSQGMPSYDIAATYAALGESHRMVEWLNRACRERNMKLFTLAQDPRFDPLRQYSGFKRIVERVGLPQ